MLTGILLVRMCRISCMDLSNVKEIKAERGGMEKLQRKRLRKDKVGWRKGCVSKGEKRGRGKKWGREMEREAESQTCQKQRPRVLGIYDSKQVWQACETHSNSHLHTTTRVQPTFLHASPLLSHLACLSSTPHCCLVHVACPFRDSCYGPWNPL